MTSWEKAAVPALVSVVPKFLSSYLSYEGWRDRVLNEAPMMQGMRTEVLLHAYDTWRAANYRAAK